MHELAICDAVLRQVLSVASAHKARQVRRITLRIGPLAGVEPHLLLGAFPLVAAGTPSEGAIIEIEEMPVRIRCNICGCNSAAPANQLLCEACGTWLVSLTSGDEMQLASVDLIGVPAIEEDDEANV